MLRPVHRIVVLTGAGGRQAQDWLLVSTMSLRAAWSSHAMRGLPGLV